MKFFTLITFSFLFATNFFAQSTSFLFTKEIKLKDTMQITDEISHFINKKRQKGFIFASVDTFFFEKNILTLKYYKGEKFYWGNFNANFSQRNFKKLNRQPVDFQKFDKILDNSLNFFINQGYPFAKINIDTMQINNNLLNVSISMQKNNFIVFDTIFFDDKNINLSEKFLQNFLQFKQNKPYNNNIVENIDKKLQNLEFV